MTKHQEGFATVGTLVFTQRFKGVGDFYFSKVGHHPLRSVTKGYLQKPPRSEPTDLVFRVYDQRTRVNHVPVWPVMIMFLVENRKAQLARPQRRTSGFIWSRRSEFFALQLHEDPISAEHHVALTPRTTYSFFLARMDHDHDAQSSERAIRGEPSWSKESKMKELLTSTAVCFSQLWQIVFKLGCHSHRYEWRPFVFKLKHGFSK